MKNTTINLRISSLFVALIMLVCMVPFNFVSSESAQLHVIHNGVAAAEIALPFNEKTTISVSDTDAELYQWQIFMPDYSQWIDIYDKTSSSCEISYTLVEKFLSTDNTSELRCKVTKDEKIIESSSIKIRIVDADSPVEQFSIAVPSSLAVDDTAKSAENEFITYTVTIKYLYYNESPNMVGSVANDYIATIAAGTDFDAEVSSPVRTGYKAYLATEADWNSSDNRWFVGADESSLTNGESIPLNIKSISEDHIVYVVYLPQPAPYHISTYFQNKYDDFYSFGESIIKEAPVGTVISNSTDLNLEREGFTMLEYNDTTVAADGSTILEIYYDRKYHLINFQLDGGYGVEPLYARYGTDFKVSVPNKAGYVFDGWDIITTDTPLNSEQLAKAAEIADTLKSGSAASIPDFDITYRAKWIKSDATYSVIYWKENANDDGYSYWGTVTQSAKSGDTITFDPDLDVFDTSKIDFSTGVVQEAVDSNGKYSSIPTRREYEFFTFDDEKSEKTKMVMGDNSTVLNVYYKRNTYNLKFYYARSFIEEMEQYYQNISPDSNGILPDGDYFVWYEISNNKSNCVLSNNRNTENKLILSGNPNDTDLCILNFQHVSGNSYYVTDDRGYYLEIGSSSANFTETQKTVDITWISSQNCWRIGQNGQYLNQHGGRSVTHAGGYNVYNDDGNNLVISEQLQIPLIYYVDRRQLASATTNTQPQNMTWGFNVAALPEINDDRYTYGVDVIDDCEYYYLMLNDVKYNQIITDLWPTGVVPTVSSFSTPEWAPLDGCKYRTYKGDNATLKVYTTLSAEIMNDPADPDGTKFVAWWANERLNDQYFHIYYSAIPGEETNTVLHNGIEYVKQPLITYKMAYNTWTQITPYEYYGVHLEESIINTEKPDSATDATQNSVFYYIRNQHTLSFHNIDTNIKSSELVYGQKIIDAQPISAEVMERDYYPSRYEKNAYTFKGWSLSPSTYVEVKWDELRMDDADLSVYAYWEKTTHNVTFYETYNDMKKDSPIPDGEYGNNDVDVPHGEPVNYASTIGREGYSFVGWFYLSERTNEKIAFLPNNMPVNKDLKIYAEWVADKMIRYTIHYIGANALKDNNGEYLLSNGKYVLDMNSCIQIADDTVGQLQDGRTKTFSAKALPELWDSYNTGYFPELASHAIMFSEDTDMTDPTVKVTKVNMDGSPYTGGDEYTYTIDYTFYYVHLDEVQYTVNYINTSTGNNMFKTIENGTENLQVESLTKSTMEAVTTERFKMINMYVPDEYQKRIVLTAYPQHNIINFYYTENQSPMFLVEHLTENLDGTWTVQVREFSTGNTNDTISRHTFDYTGHEFDPGATWVNTQGQTITPMEGDNWITNYTQNGDIYTATGTLENEKILVLRFYYKLTVHDYIVEHKILGTNEWLFGSKENSSQTGSKKYGDRFYGEAMKEEALEKGYYVDGSDIDVSRLIQSKIITDSNNVITFYYVSEPVEINYRIVVNGIVGTNISGCYVTPTLNSANSHASTVNGSVPHIADTHYFDGWYRDEECTEPVPEEWISADNRITPKAVGGVISKATYYAKATPCSLTITKNGNVQQNETFIFKVTGGNQNKNIDMVVSVTGNSSSTIECIPMGEYTVTEISDWSWKYDTPEAQNVVITSDEHSKTIEFTNNRNDNKLLGDEKNINNKFSDIN